MYAADLAQELARVTPTWIVCQAPTAAMLRRLADPVPVRSIGPAEAGAAFADAVDAELVRRTPERVVVVIPLPVEEAGTTPDPVAALEAVDARAIPTTAVFQLCHRTFAATDRARSAAGRLTARQRWVAVSRDNRSHLAATFAVPSDRLVVIPNGVALPPSERRHRRFRAELGVDRDASVVVSVGRLVASKRQADAIAAMSRLPGYVRLAIAGEGPEHSALVAQGRGDGIDRRVTLLGHRQDVPALLKDADAFVFPSVAEGASFALLEAMAAGLPVVASRSGSNGEIVRDGVDGYLHRPGDPEDIAAKLRRLAEDPALAARLGSSGRQRVEATFDRDTMVRDTLRLVLGPPGGYDREPA